MADSQHNNSNNIKHFFNSNFIQILIPLIFAFSTLMYTLISFKTHAEDFEFTTKEQLKTIIEELKIYKELEKRIYKLETSEIFKKTNTIERQKEQEKKFKKLEKREEINRKNIKKILIFLSSKESKENDTKAIFEIFE